MAKKKVSNKKVPILKPVNKVLHPKNLKVALAGVGILLLVVIPIVGFFLLLIAAVSHFRQRA